MSENGQSFLLVSQDIGLSNLGRNALSTVILPLDLLLQRHDYPVRHIWWVEKTNRSFHLRAKLFLAERSMGREPGLPLRLAAYTLDTLRSERITWSGTKTRAANVTRAVTKMELQVVGGIAFGMVDFETERQLEQCMASVCEQVLDFEDATRLLRRRFSSFNQVGSQASSCKPSLAQALSLVRCRFARQELLGIAGYSPYEVGAAVLAGYSELPNQTAWKRTVEPSSSIVNGHEFTEMDDQNHDTSAGTWNRNRGPTSATDELEFKTRKHHRIVSLLAAHIRARALLPTYNRNVDLRTECEGKDVFFEVKTADGENFAKQVRSAVGQLLEYRYRYPSKSGKEVALVAVVEATASEKQRQFACEFLHAVGIELVLWNSETGVFEGLSAVLAWTLPTALSFWHFARQYSICDR